VQNEQQHFHTFLHFWFCVNIDFNKMS